MAVKVVNGQLADFDGQVAEVMPEAGMVKKIICMFDGDAAGQRAAARSVQFIDKTAAAFLCVVLPDNPARLRT